MATHLTARMAWHDDGWDGGICRDPRANPYCVGSHSLLSERLARTRNVELEHERRDEAADTLLPEYVPPCFWSINAFSSDKVGVQHHHPFPQFRDKVIPDSLPPGSIMTWPFRLSFIHSSKKKKRDGQYPVDLDEHISEFFGRLEPVKSIVFLYLNYDNPVSGEDYKYALVGCAFR